MRLASEGRGRREHDLFPHAGEYHQRLPERRCDRTRSNALNWRESLAGFRPGSFAYRTAVHLQCIEDQFGPGFDRGDCGGVFWYADCWYWLSDLYRSRKNEYGDGLGIDRAGGRVWIGVLWFTGGCGKAGHLLASVIPQTVVKTPLIGHVQPIRGG